MGDKARILVVEDDPDSAEVLEEMLGMSGYDVRTVTTADGAVEALAANCCAAVLLDLTLGGLPTNELIDRILEVQSRPPILIFSARPADDLQAAADRLSAAAVIQKPVKMDVLLRIVARVAGSSD
jgi:DNA-binding response OmpR family regulator